MMSTAPTSLERAAREALESPSMFGGEAEPLALDGLRDKRGKLPSNVFQLVRQGEAAPRGRGRPKDSRNRRNADLAKLLIHKYGDPVEYMASLYRMPTDQLAELLGLADGAGKAGKRGDLAIKALNVQLAAAKAVAEYVHSKKPVEANVNLKSDGVIVMPGMAGGAFSEIDAGTRAAGEVIARALAGGTPDVADLAGMKLLGGQLVDAEFSEVDGDEDDPDGGRDRGDGADDPDCDGEVAE